MAKRTKIKIVQYAQSIIDPNILVAYTANGGRIDLYPCETPEERCRTKGKLYTNGHGLWFSLTSRGLNQVFENFGLARRTRGRHCHNGKRGCDYPQMRDYGLGYCHVLVCTTFHGPRPIIDGKLAVCDHKNGDVLNCSADNVEWVSVKENIWRAKHVLQVLRLKQFNLSTFTGEEMDRWFAIFRALEMTGRKPIDLSHDDLLDHFGSFLTEE